MQHHWPVHLFPAPSAAAKMNDTTAFVTRTTATSTSTVQERRSTPLTKFTVTTQFLTNNNCASGTLSQVRRLYVQDGRVIQNSNTNITGITMTDHISVAFCAAEKTALGGPDAFSAQGGMSASGILWVAVWSSCSASGMKPDGNALSGWHLSHHISPYGSRVGTWDLLSLSHLRERNDAGGDVSRRRGVILKHHGWRYRVDVLKSGGGVDRIECGCVLTILLPFCEMDGVGIEQTCRCRVSLLD